MVSIQTASWMRYNPFATSFATPMGSVWGTAEKVPFWGLQTAKKVPTIPMPSISTIGKVAAGGTILYGGYKVSEGIGRLTDTGSFTKKETKTGTGETGTIFPPPIAGSSPTYIYQAAPEPQGFFGGLGEGIGKGAENVGSGLEMALPVLAIGGLAYFLLKEKGKKK